MKKPLELFLQRCVLYVTSARQTTLGRCVLSSIADLLLRGMDLNYQHSFTSLQQALKLFYRQSGLMENTLENLRLERAARMNGHNNFLAWNLTVTKCNMTAHLMISIPTRPSESSNQPVPRNIPGELAHTATSTVASSSVVSSGINSPCLMQLSR